MPQVKWELSNLTGTNHANLTYSKLTLTATKIPKCLLKILYLPKMAHLVSFFCTVGQCCVPSMLLNLYVS